MIVTDKNFLRKKSEFCSREESENIFDLLDKEIRLHTEAVGLSAPQIGFSKRVFVIYDQYKPELKRLHKFLNPRIVELEDIIVDSYEGCLSLPGYKVKLKRNEEIVVEDEINGKAVLYGLEAICFQHEYQHLNGILIIDIGEIIIQNNNRNKFIKIFKDKEIINVKYKTIQKFLNNGWKII